MTTHSEVKKRILWKRQALDLARGPLPLIVLILFGYLYLAFSYLQANRETADLQFRADASGAALRRPSPDPAPLEAELDAATSRLEALTTSRVTSIPEEDIVKLTLLAAGETGVVVTSAGTRSDSFLQKGGEQVRATPFFVRAIGSLEQIEAFLAAIEFGPVETLEVQSALVTEEGSSRALTLAAVIYSHLPLQEPGTSGTASNATATPKTQAAR